MANISPTRHSKVPQIPGVWKKDIGKCLPSLPSLVIILLPTKNKAVGSAWANTSAFLQTGAHGISSQFSFYLQWRWKRPAILQSRHITTAPLQKASLDTAAISRDEIWSPFSPDLPLLLPLPWQGGVDQTATSCGGGEHGERCPCLQHLGNWVLFVRTRLGQWFWIFLISSDLAPTLLLLFKRNNHINMCLFDCPCEFLFHSALWFIMGWVFMLILQLHFGRSLDTSKNS